MELPLNLLRAGQRGVVSAVVGGGAFQQRLREMGFVPGRTVEMVTPGAACIVRTEGQKICYRPDAGTAVLVRLESPG